jgi:hypothetical protein
LAPFSQAVSEEKCKVLYTFLRFILFGQQIWLPRAILVSDWLLLKKSSPLKLLGQMEPILAESIYVRSSIKFLRFVPFGQQIWLPRAILVNSFRGEDLFNISQSETRIDLGSHICWPNGMKRRNFIEDLT